MGRGIDARRTLVALLLGLALTLLGGRISVGELPPISDPQAVDRFHAAAALQNRELYELAAAEWAAFAQDYPADPLVAAARYQSGVCLFQLKRFDDARSAFEQLLNGGLPLEPTLAEQCYAQLGVTQYNLGVAAEGDERTMQLHGAIATFDKQLEQFADGPLAPQSAFYCCESLYAVGEVKAAIDGYRALVNRYPEHPQRAEALYALGVAEQEDGQLSAAAETLGQFADAFPHHALADDARERRAAALYAAGGQHLANEDWSAAAREFTLLVDDRSQSELVPDALVLRARAHLGGGDAAAAEASLDRYMNAFPDHERALEAQLLRATVRHERGDFAGSIADADAVLAAEPARQVQSDALYNRGLCQLGIPMPAAAAATFEQIVQQDPQYRLLDRVLYDLAWAYQESHDADRAIATFAKLIESRPKSPLVGESWYRIGELHYSAGEYVVAAVKFQAALEQATEPDVQERAAHKLGWCRFEQQDFAAAERAFGEQVAAHPRGSLAADAQLMRSECQFRQHKDRESLNSFLQALEQPAATTALRQSALLHAAQAAARVEEWPRCLEMADRAIAEFPDAPWKDEARCERGTALFQLGRLDEAHQEFVALAASRAPTGARAAFMIGRIQSARGQHDDAIRTFFKIAYGYGDANAPEPFREWQAKSLYEAANCLEQSNRIESARKLYEELLHRFPESAQAAPARAELQQNLRR